MNRECNTEFWSLADQWTTQQRSPETGRKYHMWVTLWLAHLAHHGIAPVEATDRHATAYFRVVRDLYAANAQRQCLSALREFWAWARRAGADVRDIWWAERADRVDIEEVRTRPAKPGEISAVLADNATDSRKTTRARVRNHLLIVLAALTGLRPAEIAGLNWSDWDDDRGVLRVQRNAKRGKARRVPLTPECSAALDAWRRELHHAPPNTPILRTLQGRGHALSGNRMRATDVSAVWRQLIRRVSPQNPPTIYGCRARFATVAATDSAEDASRLMGHASPATTYRYVHLDDAPVALPPALLRFERRILALVPAPG